MVDGLTLIETYYCATFIVDFIECILFTLL